MQLEEQFYESSTARWKREVPWLRLFRAFRIAMDFRKLFLAFLGTVTFAAGMISMTQLPFSPHATEDASGEKFVTGMGARGARSLTEPLDEHAITSWPWESTFPGSPFSRQGVALPQVLAEPWDMSGPVFGQTRNLLAPWRLVIDPVRQLLLPNNTWSKVAWAWTKLLWTLIVWAIFGGAIARITALELAGEGVPSLRESLQHSIRFLLSSLGGPLLPVVAIGLFWGIGAALGLAGRLPGVGEFLVGASWMIALSCGAVLALILIGVAAAWPLMYVTISVEGSDAFDALSRAYSYVFGRPWYALWIAIVSMIYGGVVLLFVHAAIWFSYQLAELSVASGMGYERLRDLWEARRPLAEGDGSVVSPPSLGGQLRTMWTYGFFSISTVFIYSYFWVSMTIAYFLLRHAEDATPFRNVYWPPADAVSSGPALSGSAAAEYRERQAAEAAAKSVVTAPVAEPAKPV